MTRLAYVDASAIVRLVLDEPGSEPMMRWFVESERVVASVLGIIETRRAVGRHERDIARLDAVLETFVTVELDPVVARRAALLAPSTLRTLDAIHLATAIALGPELDAFVTYDDRLADAARAVGLPVVSPGP